MFDITAKRDTLQLHHAKSIKFDQIRADSTTDVSVYPCDDEQYQDTRAITTRQIDQIRANSTMDVRVYPYDDEQYRRILKDTRFDVSCAPPPSVAI